MGFEALRGSEEKCCNNALVCAQHEYKGLLEDQICKCIITVTLLNVLERNKGICRPPRDDAKSQVLYPPIASLPERLGPKALFHSSRGPFSRRSD